MKPYVKKYYILFFLVGLSTMIAALAETLIPIQVGIITDEVLPIKDKTGLLIGFFILLGLAILDLFMNFSMRYFVVRFAQRIIFDLRQDIFMALQEQELKFFSKENTGQIMERSISEIFSLRDLLTWGLRITFLVVFLFASAIISMISVSVEMALIFVLIPILIIGFVSWFAGKNKQVFYDARYKMAEVSDTLAQNLQGIQTVKSFGREKEQEEIFNVKNQAFFDASMKTAKVRATIIPGMVIIISLALIFLVFLGGAFVATNRITVGQFITFMLLSLNLAVPGRFLGWIGIVAQDANSAAIRLGEIFDAEVDIYDSPDAENITLVDGDLKFDHISFGFEGENNILCDFSLHIPAGQKVALLGATGSGKSTLINLIPRFFDPTGGRILLDDKDIKTQFTVRSLRSHISIVHQEAFLFTLSLHDNIAFGNPSASRERVIEAAKAAHIHEFIVSLEDGYETLVGERGVTLSGGQRQRVTIARTLLKNPEILVFDDSVSAIDPETEAKIQESLERASKRRTTIVISQRPSSLRYVDRIIVLSDGKIVQDGKHDSLMLQQGIYKDFINTVTDQVKFMNWDQEIEEEIQ
ncbi:MAG: ABC transporter ATP-binding protein [Candidatus Heimdallarchaeota archaeon]|nr:ABC transporter ATP-binding protein [Candidatus Heimdallarchaeota archaeon]